MQAGISQISPVQVAATVGKSTLDRPLILPILVWGVVALVRYPSAGAYLTMVATEAYKAARQHRTAALCDSRLIMTAEHASLG